MDRLTSLQSLSAVPRLEVDGGNWPIFRRKFETYMDSAGLYEHFRKENTPAKSYVEAKPTKEKDESDTDYKKRMSVWNDGESKWKKATRRWKKDDAEARAALGKVVPNSIYMEISEFRTFHEMWAAVEVCVERVTLHQKSNLKGRHNQIYCGKKGNVVTTLKKWSLFTGSSLAKTRKSRTGITSTSSYAHCLDYTRTFRSPSGRSMTS